MSSLWAPIPQIANLSCYSCDTHAYESLMGKYAGLRAYAQQGTVTGVVAFDEWSLTFGTVQ